MKLTIIIYIELDSDELNLSFCSSVSPNNEEDPIISLAM